MGRTTLTETFYIRDETPLPTEGANCRELAELIKSLWGYGYQRVRFVVVASKMGCEDEDRNRSRGGASKAERDVQIDGEKIHLG